MKICTLFLVGCVLLGAVAARVDAQIYQFETNQGNIRVTLRPDAAPNTVANFLNYVKSGAYKTSIFHRAVQGFVIQGGGYTIGTGSVVAIPSTGNIANEYNLPNVAGTIAMAKLGTDPNSANTQWYFNLADNTSTLGPTNNAGFTVFGQVADPDSMNIIQKIGGIKTYDLSATFNDQSFTTLPLTGYAGSGIPQNQNFVVVNDIVPYVAPPLPVIGAGGIITASDFGGFAAATPGSLVEIYGSDLAGTTRGWAAADFNNGYAPVSLDGVSVTVGGKPAFVNYVSPAQVNVQIPAGIVVGGQVPVVLTYNHQVSAPVMLTVNAEEGGLLAPAAFKVNGKQYVVAFHSDGVSIVGNGSIPGVVSTPAKAGETLTFYGVGFGPVGGNFAVAGQVPNGNEYLATPVSFTLGTETMHLNYPGLSTYVGLYQFNAVVPSDAPSGDLALQVTLGGSDIPQTLFLTVGN